MRLSWSPWKQKFLSGWSRESRYESGEEPAWRRKVALLKETGCPCCSLNRWGYNGESAEMGLLRVQKGREMPETEAGEDVDEGYSPRC